MNVQDESNSVNQSERNEEIPPDLFVALITATRGTINKLMQEFDLDLGCRPHPEANSDGTGTLLAYATEERIRELEAAGYTVERGENVSEAGRQRWAEVGKGDRFEGGRIAPSGLGKKPGHGGKGGPAS